MNSTAQVHQNQLGSKYKLATLTTLLLVFLVVVGLRPAAGQSTDPSVVGQWTVPQDWSFEAVHMHLLPTGKVLFWPGFDLGDNPKIWDPATNTVTTAAFAGFNIFCSGHVFLANGQLFVGGGHNNASNYGLANASLYDPISDSWRSLPTMNAGRWYPTATTLANGDVLITSGEIDPNTGNNPLPQVYQAGPGTWRDLTTAQLVLPQYPRMLTAPNGQVFLAGPQQVTRYLDTSGTGTWTIVGNRNFSYRDFAPAVMYDAGKVLYAGGGDPPTNTAEIINLNSSSPTWTNTGSMANARRQHNGTLLPDGTVLVTGGSSGGGFDNSSSPVFPAEVWNPSTGTWSTLASSSIYRGYHSTSVLLPDGRVLNAGGNKTTGSTSYQVFSPPYLFKGTPPTITSAPASIAYGSSFFVQTPDGASITKVTLIRLASVTHAFDENQRLVYLAFTQANGGLNLTAPSSANIAPAGHYMLFLVNGSGVPSVAAILTVGTTALPTPTPPSNLAAMTVSGTEIDLSWTDNSNNEDGFKIERSLDGVNFTQIVVVPPNTVQYADKTISNALYFYQVRAYNSAGNSAYSNLASATGGAPPPLVTTILPNSGPSAGSTSVTISGANFGPTAAVSFGGTAAGAVTVNNSVSITATTPSHPDGTVDVTVTNSDGQSGTLPAARLLNAGFELGTVNWTFNGSGRAAILTNGNNAHTGKAFADLTANVGDNPRYYAADATGNVIYFPVTPGDVITFGGWASRSGGNGAMRYVLAAYDSNKVNPILTSAGAANAGWGLQQQSYTIPPGYAYVTFYAEISGNTLASEAWFDDAFLSGGFAFTSGSPTLTSISPNYGNFAGGTSVTITGTNFVSGLTVTFGGVPAASMNVVSNTSITATTPLHATGSVDVVVTNPDGKSTTLPANRLANPGFELGAINWIISGTGTATVKTNSGNAHSGSNYAELTSAPGNQPLFNSADASRNIAYYPVNPGDVISFGGWANRISGDGAVRYSLAAYDGNKTNPIRITSGNTSTTSGWGYQQNSYTIPSGYAFVRFYALIYNNTVSADAYFDDALLSGGFLYTTTSPPPKVTSISPTSGTYNGGTNVTIIGTGFMSGATVAFGGIAGTSTMIAGSTPITVDAPAHAAGTVDVIVTNPDGQVATVAGGFTYTTAGADPPTITSISPNNGASSGGTSVTITGIAFQSGATVSFSGVAATSVNVVSASSITATTPSHAGGTVDVVVTNGDSQFTTLAGGFTFNAPLPGPAITSISPNSGTTDGGTSVTITGTNFVSGATVSFGGVAATSVNVVSTSSITATTPSHAVGAVDVVVTNPDAQFATLTGGYTFTANPPAVTSISLNHGSSGGGTSVTITGTNFVSGLTVTFGGVPAASMNVVSSTSITAATPPHAAGSVDVVVTNPDGQSATLPANRLANPGFELGGVNWKLIGTGTAVVQTNSGNAHSGSKYAELTSASGNHPTFYAADASGNAIYFPVNPGDLINFGGWANRISGDGSVRFVLATYDVNKANPIRPNSGNASTTPGWGYQQNSYTIPSGYAFVRFYAEIYNNAVSADAYFDDAVLSGGFLYTLP